MTRSFHEIESPFEPGRFSVGQPISGFRGSDQLVLDGLEIHPPMDTDGARDRFGVLPAYIVRQHDRGLKAVVDAAVAGRSGIAVLVGGSSTGKTRALWEAVRELPAPWRLWHPLSPTRADAALAGLTDIAPHTVVWLNEAQHYLGPELVGEHVAAGLRELFHDPLRAPVLVLATLWSEHWDTLTTRSDPDRHAQARHLLVGHEIDVPDSFSRTDIAALDTTADADPRLTEAAQRADHAQITQYLAGVPVLMARYNKARAAERALIHAAMDVRRMGAGPHIPLAWLADAARGYLTDAEDNALEGDWLTRALAYATQRCNGIPGILAPVNMSRPRNQRRSVASSRSTGRPAHSPHGPHYVLADYLDQHGRHHRAQEIPPIDFWTAAAQHAHPTDLTALGTSAWKRGLYRDATQLFKSAPPDADVAATLVTDLYVLHPADRRPAQWAAANASLDNPYAVARLLDTLREVGAWEYVDALLDRDPATHVTLDEPLAVAVLLDSLRMAGAQKQVKVLLDRDIATHISLDRSDAVAVLLDRLWDAGAQEQVEALATRAAARAPLGHWQMAMLLNSLQKVGAGEQAKVLAARIAAHTPFAHWPRMASLLDGLRKVGAEDQAESLATRIATHISLDGPSEVAGLLVGLQEVGAHEQVKALLDRAPAAHTPLDSPFEVSSLLGSLRKVGAHEQVKVLLDRAPAVHVTLGRWPGVSSLLVGLQEVGAHEQVKALLDRAPAAHTPLDSPFEVSSLLDSLRKAGALEQAEDLARRAAADTPIDDPQTVSSLLDSLRKVGAHEQVKILLDRDPAVHVTLGHGSKVSSLLDSLRKAGAQEQLKALAARAVDHAPLGDWTGVTALMKSLQKTGTEEQSEALAMRLPAAGHFDQFLEYGENRKHFRFGREPDGSSAPSWTWDDVD
jgi:hypothetical protein